MSYRCAITGKGKLVGNKVSHSNNKTKMAQKPNLHAKVIFDPQTGKKVRMRISTKAIRTLDKVGSLSKFKPIRSTLD